MASIRLITHRANTKVAIEKGLPLIRRHLMYGEYDSKKELYFRMDLPFTLYPKFNDKHQIMTYGVDLYKNPDEYKKIYKFFLDLCEYAYNSDIHFFVESDCENTFLLFESKETALLARMSV